MPIRKFRRGDRGFFTYGRPFKDSYGAELEVYESSSAEGRFVWLKIAGDVRPGRANASSPPGSAWAHLSIRQAEALVARLEGWVTDAKRGGR